MKKQVITAADYEAELEINELFEGFDVIANYMEAAIRFNKKRPKGQKLIYTFPYDVCEKPQYVSQFGEDGFEIVKERTFFLEDMEFVTSWDWLMPIHLKLVQELEKGKSKLPALTRYVGHFVKACVHADVNTAFNAVVEGIKELNYIKKHAIN